MAFSTYGELKAAVATNLGRSDLTTPIIDFVGLAHSDIMRDLRNDLRLQKRDTAFSISTEYVAVPSDFIELVSIYLNTNPKAPLTFLPSDQMNAYTTTGQPRYVTLVGATTPGTECLRFAPAPDGTYTATMEYYGSVTYFANDNATNWILTRHPGLYLYGACFHACIHLRDIEGAQGYKMQYDNLMAMVKQEASRTRWGANGMRVRPG